MIIQGEFIGHQLQVISSCNEMLIGRQGKILDETKETFTVREGKEFTILKKGSTFQIDDLVVEGDKIAKRPEERLKLK